MGGEDGAVIGVFLQNTAGPFQNVVLGTEVQHDNQIFRLAHGKGAVGVLQLTFMEDAGLAPGLELVVVGVGSQIAVQGSGVVVVAADKGIEDLSVHQRDGFLGGSPLLGLVAVRDVTQTDNALDLLRFLIVQNPLVVLRHILRIVACDVLGIADDSEGVCVIGHRLLILQPVHLGFVGAQIVAVAAEVFGGGGAGGQLVPYHQIVVVRFDSIGVVGLDLIGGTDIGVHGNLADFSLEVLGVAAAVVAADADSRRIQLGGKVAVVTRGGVGGLNEFTVDVGVRPAGGIVLHYGDMYPIAGGDGGNGNLGEFMPDGFERGGIQLVVQLQIFAGVELQGNAGGGVARIVGDNHADALRFSLGDADDCFKGQRFLLQILGERVELIRREGHAVVVRGQCRDHKQDEHEESCKDECEFFHDDFL